MILAIDEAIKHLGIGEDPPHSNAGPCMMFALPGETPASWCGRFVRFCKIAEGKPLPGNQWLIPSVSELQKALALADAWIPAAAAIAYAHDGVGAPEALPRRNDLVLLNEHGVSDTGRVGHHVGIVEMFDTNALIIQSIDGNWSDKVCRVSRKLGSPEIWGFGRWPL